ncbi:MAG: fibrobacter succinogenes major paralogous domain-containing protein [Bacteroidales bacterium]|nr:fibrobacter succinogenes major paralogous domain-containing protein [Bacteroidales bacterium]
MGANTGNYTISYTPANLTITKHALTIAAVAKTYEYNGSNQGPAGTYTSDFNTYVTVTGLQGTDALSSITMSGSQRDVNTYTNEIVPSAAEVGANTGNYTISYTPADLKITQRDLAIVINTSKFYDGTVMVTAYDSTGVTISGNAAGDVLTAGKVTTNGASVGTYTYADNTVTISEPFDITHGISNYNVSYTIVMKIVNANTMEMFCPIALTDTEKVYDGTAVSYTVTASVSTSDVVKIEYSTDNVNWSSTNIPSITNVGTQLVYARASAQNYDTATCQYTLKVTPRPITITATSDSKMYDGTALTKDAYTVTSGTIASTDVLNAVTVTGTRTYKGVSNNVPSNAVIYTNGTTTDVTSNYDITYANGTLTVEANNKPIVVTSATNHWTYDGNNHKDETYTLTYDGTPVTPDATGKVFTLPTGDKVTVTPTAAGVTNVADNIANNNTFTCVLSGDTNYTAAPTTVFGSLSIDKLDITVAVADTTVNYNGTEQYGKTSYTFSNLLSGHTANITYTPSSGTNASSTPYNNGSYDLTTLVVKDAANNNVTANYNLTTATAGKLTINPINVIVTIVGAVDTADYDGQPHTVTGYTATANTPLYDVNTDFTFTPADGSTLVGGVIAATRQDAGTTYMGLAPAQFVNTNANFATVTFNVTDGHQTVEPINVTVNIVGKTDTKPYDGIAHTVTGFTATASTTLYKVSESDRDFSFTGSASATRTNVVEGTDTDGQTDMGLTESQFANTNPNFDTVRFVVTDGWQKIEPINATVYVTGHNNTSDYDGTEHSVSGFDTTYSTPLYKGTYFTFSGTAYAARTNVVEGTDTDGQTDMGLAASQFANTNPNFATVTFDVTDGYQKINPVDVIVTVVGTNNTAQYDGNAHTVTGYTATANNTLYDVAHDFTFSGRDTATRTNVVEGTDTDGKTEMGLAQGQFANTNPNFATVTFNVTDGYQQINKINATVTIVGAKSTDPYDGNAHTVNGYTATSSTPLYKVTGSDIDFSFSGNDVATRTNVVEGSDNDGQTDMGLAASQFTNNNTNFDVVTFNVTDGYQKITPINVTVTITGHHDAATFDNVEHSVSGYDVAVSNSLYTTADFTFSGSANDSIAKRTEVGTTYMNLLQGQFANTNTNFASVTFNVTKGYQTINALGTVVVTIRGHHNTTDYDGAAHRVSGYDVTISSSLYTTSDFAFNGTANDSIAERTDAGTTNMGLTSSMFTNTNTNFSNVTFDVTDGYQQIDKINATVTVTGHNNTTNYDGTEHSVSGFDTTYSTPLYKGTYFTFSGTAYAARTNVVEGTDTDGQTDMGLAAGQFTNNNPNFDVVTFNVTDGYQKINKINATVTVTGHKNTTAYDGNSHTVAGFDTTFSTTLYKGSYFTFSGRDTATRTNVVEGADADGKTDMGLVASQFTNNNPNFDVVTFNVTDGYQIITPINASVTITGHYDTKVYNGAEQRVTGYDVTIPNTLYHADDFTFSGDSVAKRTDVGTTNMNLANTQFVNTNTNFATVTFTVLSDGYLTITPSSDLTITLPIERTKTYDGTPLSGACTASATYGSATPTMYYSVDGGSTFRDTIPTITDFGTLTVIARASCPNYSSVDSTFTLSITKRDVTLKSADLTKAYDGTPLVNGTTALAQETGFVSGEGATYSFTSSQTLVGTSPNSFIYTLLPNTKAANYTVSASFGVLEVTNDTAAVVINSNTHSWTYDGVAHTYPSYTVTYKNVAVAHISGDSTMFRLPTGDTLSITVPASITDFGSVENTYNYSIQHQAYYSNVTAHKGTISILKREVTLTGETDTVIYSGATQSISGITADNLVSGHTWTINYEAAGMAAGTYPGAFSGTNKIMDGSNDVTNNYTVTLTPGWLTIEPVNTLVKVTITEHTDTVMYDGQPHTVTGYDVATTNSLYTPSSFNFTGNVADTTMTATNVGTQNSTMVPSMFVNVDPDFQNVEFEIVRKGLVITKNNLPVVITSGTHEFDYDGTAHSFPSYEVTYNGTSVARLANDSTKFELPTGDTLAITSLASITNYSENAPNNNKFAYMLQNASYYDASAVDTVFGTISIKPIDVTVTITEHSDTVDYNGSEQMVTGYDVAIGNPLYQVTDFSFSGPDTAKGTDAGTYPMSLNSSNFTNNNTNFATVTFSIVDGQLVIEPIEVTVTVADKTVEYNGSEQYGNTECTFNNVVSGHTATITYTPSHGTLASTTPYDNGLFTASTFKVMDGSTDVTSNYTLGTQTKGKLTINNRTTPYEITVVANSSTGNVYDGTSKSVAGFETLSFTVDGNAYTVEGLSTSDPSSVNADTIANAISGTAVVKDVNNNDVTAQFMVYTTDGELAIAKRYVKIITDGGSKLFDGTPLTNPNYTIVGDGFVTGEVSGIHTTGTVTAINTCVDNTITFTQEAAFNVNNYTIEYSLGQLCITGSDKPITITSASANGLTPTFDITEASSIVYDGNTHGEDFKLYKVTYDGVEIAADAGSNGLVFTLPTTDKLTVTPTFAGVTNVADANNTNNNNTFTYTITNGGVDVADAYVGTKTITAGTVKIRKRNLNIGLVASKVYDGTKLTVNVPANLGNGTTGNWTISGLASGEYITAGTVETESYVVGDYYCTDNSFNDILSWVAFQSGFNVSSAKSNYSPTFNVKLSITALAIEISAISESKVYDCTDLEKDAYTITGGALATTDHIDTVFVTGLQHCVGSSANVPSGAIILHGTDTVTSSYSITYVNGTLEILPVTTGFDCPADLNITLWHSTCDTNVTLPANATLTPSLSCVTITNDLVNPLPAGVHTVTWSLKDECGNLMATCDQTITVNYPKCDTAIDWDGNIYPSERIGCNCWTVPNLKSEHYSDGTAIANYTSYDNKDSLENIYGKLYSWYSAVRVAEDDDSAVPADSTSHSGPYVEGICPAGWALPTVAEYLEMFAASGSDAGLVKSPSTDVWLPGRQGIAPNKFNAFGAGYYDASVHRYYNLLGETHFWAADYNAGSATAKNYVLNYYCSDGLVEEVLKGLGYSIRCVQKK